MGIVLKDMATQSLAILAVVALLVSALGPMLDHHFAERHPAHGHLYLGAVGPEHSHPFEHSHVHYDELYAPAPGDENIIFFAPYDGSGHAHADLAVPVSSPSPLYSDDGGPLLGNGGDDPARLQGIALSPLRQPPKA